MSNVDWPRALDLELAVANLRAEMVGDWYQDPWGWPELNYMLKKDPALAYAHCDATVTLRPALIDVPKENWGTRPAVVLDVRDRLIYQAIVDRLSGHLQGSISPNVFGWRISPSTGTPGVYSRNSFQWKLYRDHLSLLSEMYEVSLVTDLASCFASIPVERLQETVQDWCPNSRVRERLCSLVEGFGAVPGRTGLPQRSTASAVLANAYILPLDDVLLHYSQPLMARRAADLQYHSFARWMDDMWLFSNDVAEARHAQKDLQSEAQSLGLNLNSAKTRVYEGDDVAHYALKVEHSAVDSALAPSAAGVKDFGPLEELIDRLLDAPETASRTSLKFALNRMCENGRFTRAQQIAGVANRMPHAADALFRFLRQAFTHDSLQDWYLEYAEGPWAMFDWSIAELGRIFPSSRAVRKPLRTFFASAVCDANTSLPLLAVAAQRLLNWDRSEARAACSDAFARASSPHARRVIALTALSAGESRSKVRRWLADDRESEATLKMLEDRSYRPPPITRDFAE